MKINKKYLFIFVPIIIIVFFIMMYQPVQEGVVYSRKVEFTPEKEPKNKRTYEEKLILSAKEKLLTLLQVDIKQDEYNEKVTIDSTFYGKNINVAKVEFELKRDASDIYSITFDSTSSNVLEIFTTYKESGTSEYMSQDILEQRAKTFLEKINGKKVSDFSYTSSLSDNIFGVTAIDKTDYHKEIIYVHPYTGAILFYQSL